MLSSRRVRTMYVGERSGRGGRTYGSGLQDRILGSKFRFSHHQCPLVVDVKGVDGRVTA